MHYFNVITDYSFAYGRKSLAGWIAFAGILLGAMLLWWHKK